MVGELLLQALAIGLFSGSQKLRLLSGGGYYCKRLLSELYGTKLLERCVYIHYRLSCGCTENMTYSSLPAHSDCIQRAYILGFYEKLKPRLYVSYINGTRTRLTFPYYLYEVNNRTDYKIKHAINQSQYGANSSLELKASGLYHFKVTVVKPGYTFCDLEAYFIIFVANAPLPHPVLELVRVMTAICFGTALLVVFLLKYHSKL